jgi:hypothetical protein
LSEFFPGLRLGAACDAFMDQENVGPGDGLVIEVGFAMKSGESLQGSGEFFQGFEDRALAKVCECEADVVGVVDESGGIAPLSNWAISSLPVMSGVDTVFIEFSFFSFLSGGDWLWSRGRGRRTFLTL